MRGDCRQKPPGRLLQGIEEFNAGQFYQCHDTLERLWREESTNIRNLYKGILQIGVALYHERNGNRRGALKLLSSGITLITPFAPVCLGIDVAMLVDAAARAKSFLEQCEPGQTISRQHMPRIRLAETGSGL